MAHQAQVGPNKISFRNEYRVGKFGQPIPMSSNTDTTFIIRYDQ